MPRQSSNVRIPARFVLLTCLSLHACDDGLAEPREEVDPTPTGGAAAGESGEIPGLSAPDSGVTNVEGDSPEGSGQGSTDPGDAGTGEGAGESMAELRLAVVTSCELSCDGEAMCGIDLRGDCVRDCAQEEGTMVAAAVDSAEDRVCLEAMEAYLACLSTASCVDLRNFDACEDEEETEERACASLSWWRD